MADLIFQGRQAICRRLMDAEVERDKLTPEQCGDFARFAWEKGAPPLWTAGRPTRGSPHRPGRALGRPGGAQAGPERRIQPV